MSAEALSALEIPCARIPVAGIPLAAVDYEWVVRRVTEALSKPGEKVLTLDATNTHGVATASHDPWLHRSMLTYDALLPDGRPLVWWMRAKGSRVADTVAGAYLIESVLGGLPGPTRIALIGGHAEMHRRLVEESVERFPLAEYVLLYDAPFSPVDEQYIEDCLALITASRAQLVFVLLGVPRQYYWVALAAEKLEAGACISIGGAFSYITGETHPAPRWMQVAGLWWLHRLLHDPRRLLMRYLKYNALFVWLLITREILTGRLLTERCRRRP